MFTKKYLKSKKDGKEQRIEISIDKENFPCHDCRVCFNDAKAKEVYLRQGDVYWKDRFGEYEKEITNKQWFCLKHTKEYINYLEKDIDLIFESGDKEEVVSDLGQWLIIASRGKSQEIKC